MSTSNANPVLRTKMQGTALITGASGFIGRNLRTALLASGVDVVSLLREGSPEPKEGRGARASYEDLARLTEIVREERPRWVFHLAGATKGVTYEDFQRANVTPTKNLLAALLEGHGEVERFVHVSSLAAYGPSTLSRPHREGDPRRPIEHYGQSKLEAEQVVEAIGGQLPWTILRPGGVYGPADVDYFNLFKEIESGRNVFFGNRDRAFSAVYVDDLVRAIVEGALSEGTKSKGYFICDGAPITWGDFQQAIVEASGRKVMTLSLPEALVDVAAFFGELATKVDKKPRLFNRQKAKMGAQEAWTCQHEAAARDFGYAPEVMVPEGVRRALEWYRAKGWL